MFKIAILGCENSHADSFLKLIITDKLYTDIEVVGVYSDDAEAAAKLNEKYGVYVGAAYDEFVGKVDGIMITARHGANHYKYAKPYIASGIPMFIDKPITCDEAEAVQFMKELKANGVRVTGGSTCVQADYVKQLKKVVEEQTLGAVLGGYLRAPVNMNNAYGNFYFYAAHLIQVTEYIFGYYPKSVLANVNGKVNTVIFKYENFNVCASYVDGNYVYYASVSAEKGVEGSAYPVSSACYAPEFDNFYQLLKGEAQHVSYNDFIAPVFAMTAIERSIASGKEETINPCEEI